MTAAASAQDAGPAGAPSADPPVAIPSDRLPAEVRLGARVEHARRLLPVARTVVLVPTPDAYLDAVARWSLETRFPVLIDDGSEKSRARVARFVRAFEPVSVVRWAGDGTHNLSAPVSADDRERLISDAAARAWNSADTASLKERWNELGFEPPGVVVASLFDPAWPAAVALAAGRGQPIVWVREKPPGSVGVRVAGEVADALLAEIADRLDGLGYEWRAVGDTIDALTLCLNIPVRVNRDGLDPPGPVSLTDLAARHAGVQRWGWAGIVIGDEADAAWRAMCALFLQPDSAWLADGYRDREPFNLYKIEPAAELLTAAGLTVRADPRTTITDWRTRARLGVEAGFVHVNSSNGARAFNLVGGRAPASDTPALWRPAIVHFVHSFSAAAIDDTRTIARQWLDRGAYVFVGSVHEPFLSAFHTPGRVAQRWLAPAPLGAAIARDRGSVWRVLYVGDPLITFGPRAPESAPPELPGAERLDDLMRDVLRERDLAAGLAFLTMLGRDADAARLARATLEDPALVTPEVARAAWRPLLRTGQIDALLATVERLGRADSADEELTDLLWLALRPALEVGDARAIATLSVRLRPDTYGDDAADLADAITRDRGSEAARRFLAAVRDRAPGDNARQIIDRAMTR